MVRYVFGALVLACTAVFSAPASAQARPGLVDFGVEAFGALALDTENRDAYGPGFGGALSIDVNIAPVVAINVGGLAIGAVGDQASGSASLFGGRAGAKLRWSTLLGLGYPGGWVDAHLNYATSDSVGRAGFDVGLGYDFALSQAVHLGPFARYHMAKGPDSARATTGHDLHLAMVGIALTLDPWGKRGARRGDADGDGVDDERDECPNAPSGARPDAAHPGCPLRDADGDGIVDDDDSCPDVPAGKHADGARRGCPLRDEDGDGVADAEDACPGQAAGAHPDPQRPGCPARDTDGDGVFDDEDQCASEPSGRFPDPKRPGCPLPDRDGDSVPDAFDACPDQVGAPSQDKARSGCPGLVRVHGGQIQILQPVYFASGDREILEASFPVLAAVADAMQASQIPALRIEGHTDSRGPDKRNLALSQKRADMVREFLIERGIEPHRLQSEGFGETRPVASNKTRTGRAANRRVEFHILDAAVEAPSEKP